MASESTNYLAVLKAQYDYEPQPDGDDELEIKEGQLLFLVERTDEEWWKVKVKTDNQEEDGPVGLVPAAYVELAEHISIVKALYDYDAAQPGELSIKEDEVLFVYGQDEDWLLVQSQNPDGKVGFIPANYIEEATDDGSSTSAPAPAPGLDLSSIVVPDSPPRPEYVDPQERVNQSKAKAEAGSVETWSVSEVDKKGKKKKGTLGIGAGAMFFASESDKTPVQKWQTSDIKSVNTEKNKHVHIEVGGPNATTLHFHTGSKDAADAILAKLENSRPAALERPVSPVERPRSTAKSVHFDSSEPKIIPPREDAGSPEPEEQHGQDGDDGERAAVLYDFTADGDDEMSVHEGDTLIVLERDTDEWWKCRNQHGAEGVVPANYLELVGGGSAVRKTDDFDATAHLKAREEEERTEQQRREREEVEEKEKARKAEAEQRAKAAAAAAEADQRRRQQERQKQREKEERDRTAAEEAAQKKAAQRAAEKKSNGSSSSGRSSSDKRGPPPSEKTRTWHDKTGQFRVEAAFLGFANGKLRLHKVNGVIIEVPSEKMSQDDMRYVEKFMAKEKAAESSHRTSDDEPLEMRRRSLQPQPRVQPPAKKGSTVDWFEFFLSAGCDVDDCTRYASSFERDKIDESILPDITESTMRSLGLREGDIIRVKKAIEQKRASKGPSTSDTTKQDQIRRDEELAKQLQAEENGSSSRSQAPNLFAGPNGALKNNVRRGRPQPSKSLPPASVDLQSISSASDQIGRSSTPLVTSPVSTTTTSPTPAQSPPRASSAAAASGFDDDAWTNRPSSTKPIAPTSPAQAAITPVTAPPAPTPPPAPLAPAPAPTTTVSPPAPPASAPPIQQNTGSKLVNTTDDDIFNQLARLSQLRTQSPAIAQRPTTTSPPVVSPPPVSYQNGLGMGPSPVPMGQHLQAQQTGMLLNGPRGPFAPIPANQGLLQPLVPTATGYNNFVPTRPTSAPVQQFQPSNPSFLSAQPTGFQPSLAPQPTGFQSSLAPQPTGFQPSSGLMLSQPTGFQPSGPMMSQPTGFPNSGFGGAISPFQNTGSSFNSVQSNPTGFNPGFGQFGSPAPPQPPAQPGVNTNPANIFAQMKSGTFASDNVSDPQSAAKYDALRTNSLPLAGQPTGWGGFQGVNNFQTGYGYQQ